jgi:CheY-like chemotaxis protein
MMNMRVLLVEDEESKRSQVIELLAERFPDIAVTEARSLNAALRRVTSDRFDLLILDMTMPTFDVALDEDGGRPQAYGGRELLRHMKRRGIVTPTVVLTQFDRFGIEPDQRTIEELGDELAREHSQSYVGSITYDVAIDAWQATLCQIVESVLRKQA